MRHAWRLERPSDHFTIDERVENATTNGKAEVGLGVHVGYYLENSPLPPSDGNDDTVALRIVATGNTRRILEYDWSEGFPYLWVDDSSLSEAWLFDDDIVCLWMHSPETPDPLCTVRFYGGPGTAEYTDIYVCSNGWLSFYDPMNTTTPSPYQYYEKSIPDTAGLNNFVAPLWRDLKPGDSGYIKIRYGWCDCWSGTINQKCFVVSWNAKDRSGNPQIFQALLQMAPPGDLLGGSPIRNSLIYFQYKTVTIDDSATVGVEDQGGLRGVSYDYHNLRNNWKVAFGDEGVFHDSGRYAYIADIAIKLSNDEQNAETFIDSSSELVRGTHVNLNQALPPEDPSEMYTLAIGGTNTLLTTVFSPFYGWVPGVGFFIECGLMGYEFASYTARKQAAASLFEHNNTYARAVGYEPNYGTYPVDADLCISAYWILKDQNTADHSLTVTAELCYEELDGYLNVVDRKIITTSVKLTLFDDNNGNINTPPIIVSGTYDRLFIGTHDVYDYYRIYASSGQRISFSASKTSTETDFYLFLHNPAGTEVASAGPGSNLYINYFADSSGYWILEVRAHVYSGIYSMTTSVITIPPGGGCPILYVRGKSCYDCEGLLDIHNPEGTDVVRNHTLNTTPAPINGLYSMRLVEHPQTHSRIDQVKLYAKLEDNTTIQLPLIWAWHSENGFVLPQLLFSDDWKTETLGADWNNGTSQSIDLRFLALPQWINVIGFIFQIEGNNPVWKR